MDFINPQDYQNLANNFVKGAPGQGAFGATNYQPLRDSKANQASAFQQLAMARIRQQGAHQKTSNDLQDLMMQLQKGDQNTANILGFAQLPLGIGSFIHGLDARGKARQMQAQAGQYPEMMY